MIVYLKEKALHIQETWDTFAERIGLSSKQISAIRSNNLHLPSSEQKLWKAIDLWYMKSLPLEKFVCGLYKMEFDRIADEIAEKYCGGRKKKADVCTTT